MTIDPPIRLAPLQPDSLVIQVHEALRDAITSGGYAMGEKLVEVRLAEELGVSRGPLREALHRLGQEGLVEHLPRRGTFVRSLSTDDLVNICNLRVGLETVAVRAIIGTKPPLDSAKVLITEMRPIVKSDARPAFVIADLRFHEELCRLTGNTYLLEAFSAISAQIRMGMAMDERSTEELGNAVDEHAHLLDLLERGSERDAVAAIQTHIIMSMQDKIERRGGDAGRIVGPLVDI